MMNGAIKRKIEPPREKAVDGGEMEIGRGGKDWKGQVVKVGVDSSDEEE